MKQFDSLKILAVFVILAFGCSLAGCAATKHKPGEVFACVPEGKLEKNIAPEAELEEFACVFQQWKGSETLHFKVALRNVSQEPQRYRVNIFLENGKAVGGLIPRKTKKGLVQPGQTASFVYPVKGMDVAPKAITLIVRTMGK